MNEQKKPFKNFTIGMFRQWFAECNQETFTKDELWEMFNQACPLLPPHDNKTNYVDSMTPEERIAQQKILDTAVMTTASDKIEESWEAKSKLYDKWDRFWAKESVNTLQTNLTADTRGIIIDFIYQVHQEAVQEEREKIKKIIRRYSIDGKIGGSIVLNHEQIDILIDHED